MGKLNWAKQVYFVFVLCATTAIALPAQTFTTLHNFDFTDGNNPNGALVQATGGNLYGTTGGGGASSACTGGCGTVYKISPSGALTTLHSFDSTDGAYPGAVLVQATHGDFYGTTGAGGPTGWGTVFKVTPSGTLTTLYSFCSESGCTDGIFPSGLVQAIDGNFYGTTVSGGASSACTDGCGTVFRITPGGTLTTLHSFDHTDGADPDALVQATDGNFYGTTAVGGVGSACGAVCGTVFKITPTGTLTTLHSFDGTDGSNPFAGLVQATNGNFYGTTAFGGANGDGTVFKITPTGTLTTLYSFCSESGCTDGAGLFAGLVQATDGNFYGTTESGGVGSACGGGCGTVFEITPGGTLTTVHSFDLTDGFFPETELVQDTNGNFYGAVRYGGVGTACEDGCGTVFSLSVGLGPFVETQPTSGRVGSAVKILGTNLTGATSVTFNGKSATFKVVSNAEIRTRVPARATTGKVKVVKPSGTLTSNVSFRVLP